MPVGGPRVRAVLALLVAGAGRPVSVAALARGLWGSRPPPDAERTVRTYVSRLRTALRPVLGGAPAVGSLLTCPPGYALRTGPTAVDAGRFERLAAAGRRDLAAGCPERAEEQLAAALALWRGEAYGEFPDCAALQAEAARLAELRLGAVEDRVDAELAAGAGSHLVPELAELTRAHPARERLWAALMVALYRSGRQAAALAAYARARARLAGELGLEAGPALVETHRRVLAQDRRLDPGDRP
ncbi:MAG TPA: AfsR/SARP family transcriptional regulator, partial [Mycobacteriales bacterium]|nr:AfsR/SARP family transcriptional regulator [Mycobacteriales bacterium]